jgi:hypothetical protein
MIGIPTLSSGRYVTNVLSRSMTARIGVVSAAEAVNLAVLPGLGLSAILPGWQHRQL